MGVNTKSKTVPTRAAVVVELSRVVISYALWSPDSRTRSNSEFVYTPRGPGGSCKVEWTVSPCWMGAAEESVAVCTSDAGSLVTLVAGLVPVDWWRGEQ